MVLGCFLRQHLFRDPDAGSPTTLNDIGVKCAKYKCPYCDKRGVSVATVTLHIKSRHPGKPHNEYFDE
ncbi:zinc finger, C2H2 type, partial [Ostertagia ostertagi]